ncbi:MAG: nucleotidyltransferase [Planctomycetota bacterium]|jgi:predicted nucleotidyltransferase
MKLQKDLREFIELLNARGVKYLIVGGYAVAFHGRPRYTGDIDLFIEASAANSERMAQVIRELGFADVDLSAADFVKEGVIVQLGAPPNRIDLITSTDAVAFEEGWANKVEATLDGVPVFFISKELLLQNKAAIGRPQDIADMDAMGEET